MYVESIALLTDKDGWVSYFNKKFLGICFEKILPLRSNKASWLGNE